MRPRLLALALILLAPSSAFAEWQIKPFVGIVFGGTVEPTVSDPESAVGEVHGLFGVSAVLIGEIVGIEGDVARAAGLFKADQGLVSDSNAVTVTGNVVIAMPRRLTQYTLRPYFVGGAGLMRASSEGFNASLPLAEATFTAIDMGGGATGFLTNRLGVNWEIRRFWSVGGGEAPTATISGGPQQLAFWRATMALAIRF